MEGIKKSIIVNGKEYKIMKIRIPVSNDDVRFESSWYTRDPRKQEKEELKFNAEVCRECEATTGMHCPKHPFMVKEVNR